MDWQFIAMWLVVGAVVIWIAAKLLDRYVFGGKDKKKNDPPCCG